MLVTRENFRQVIDLLSSPAPRAIDTETTGLMAYKNDYLFSIIIADASSEYYFNFYAYKDLEEKYILPREWLKEFSRPFNIKDSLWFGHNFKFDLHMLAREGLLIAGTLHCTQAIARVEYNAHLKYSLDECAKRINLAKDDAVEEYISKNKLYDWEIIPGKKQRNKLKFFTKVPFEIMHKYGEKDARVTYELGISQVTSINNFSNRIPSNLMGPNNVMHNERQFTRTCFEIEKTGVLVNLKYCKEAAEYEALNMKKASDEFLRMTGVKFVNSAKVLAPIFKEYGETFPKTDKGNDRFDKHTLDGFKSPVALLVKDYRKAEKRAAYFYSYIYYADKNGVIHADIKQSGTESGRVSYGNPNFQNVPKRGEDDSKYPVRRAVIPRPGYVLYMLDYDSLEYKMMVDYAAEMDLVKKMNAGLDIHVACQELMGLSDRNTAKTMNFLKLYGGGAQKLADALGITLQESRALSQKYWERLPKVADFIQRVSQTAKNRGYIINWFGRVCQFPNSQFAYAAPNHLIQGGCADMVKKAMNNLSDFLKDKKSRMIIQVHDELIFEIHESEQYLVPVIKNIMETAYPYKHVPLTCSVEYSEKSWFDKREWGELGDGTQARDAI